MFMQCSCEISVRDIIAAVVMTLPVGLVVVPVAAWFIGKVVAHEDRKTQGQLS